MPYVYVQTPHPVRGNGLAIAALITGLIGLVLTVATGWIPIVGFFLMLFPSVLAIIFGLVGKAQARRGASHGGAAAAGLTCGFVALLLTSLMQLCWGVLIGGVVMSAAEMVEPPAIENPDQMLREIQKRVESDWARIEAKVPEIEIEIDEQDTSSVLTLPPAETTTESAQEPQSEGVNEKKGEKRDGGTEPAAGEATGEPLVI